MVVLAKMQLAKVKLSKSGWRSRARYSVLAAFLIACSFSITGCGSADGLGPVTGTVKLDGQPLPDAAVEFTPVNGKGLTSYGRTDANGYYFMMATRSDKGAAVGRNKVKITTYEVIDNSHSVAEKVPTKYNSASELEVDVKSSANTFDFDLSTTGGRVVNRKNDPANQ